MNLEEMLTLLPNLKRLGPHKFKVTNDDSGYTATLYRFDGDWHVTWIPANWKNVEEDVLLDFADDTPTEVVVKAYNFCKDKGLID